MYPHETVELARVEHLERLEAIAISQQKGEAANLEKKQSQSADLDPDGKKKVRGEA